MMIDIPHRRFTPSARRLPDPRWPAVAAALAHLRAARRRSVRIVDAECGDGRLLVQAVLHARALGFTAIEGRGIGTAPALLARARIAAAGVRDPAIGLEFGDGDPVAVLAEEAACPADILLWYGGAGGGPEFAHAVGRAARIAIGAARQAAA